MPQDIKSIKEPTFIFSAVTYCITGFNDAALQLYEYAAEELNGMPLDKLQPDIQLFVPSENAGVIDYQKEYFETFDHVTKNGKVIKVRSVSNRHTSNLEDVWVVKIIKVQE